MMKCIIRASFSPFFSSIIGRRDAASLKFSIALLSSFQFKVEDLRQTLHSSAVEDDEDSFSELGQQLKPRRKGSMKLMTEKIDNITKHNRRRNINFVASKPVKDPGKSCTTEKDKDVSSNKLSPNGKSGTCNRLLNSFLLGKKVMEQPKASIGVPNEMESCTYELEIADSRQPTIYAAKVMVDSSNLLIHNCPADEVFTIGISGICTKTSDSTVCAVCGSFGILLGIKRTGETSVDAVFRVKDRAKRNRLLQRLNSTIKDDCHWKAHVESSGVSSPAQKDNNQCVDLASDIKHQIDDLRHEFVRKRLLCDDLINLHRSIMSLEAQHTDLPKADRK